MYIYSVNWYTFSPQNAKLNCCNYLLRQLKCVYSLLSVRKAIADCNTMIYISWKILSFISRDPGICKYMRINSSFMRTFTYIQGILSAKILSLLNHFFFKIEWLKRRIIATEMPSNIHVTSGLLLMETVFVWAACNSESERDNFPCIFNWSTDALLILLFFLLTELSNIKKNWNKTRWLWQTSSIMTNIVLP